MELNYDSELMLHVVENTIQQMPEQRQRIYTMSRKRNMTNDEIATFLGLSKRTVEKHISLALEQIRSALGRVEFWILLFFLK